MTPPAILGIGTAAFLRNYGIAPGVMPGESLLRAAVERGVRYIDTAADYGESELALGRVPLDGVRLCTKIKPSATLDAVHASIERLRRTPDTILMHSAGREEIASAAAVGALCEAKRQGLTERIGASTYGVADASFALNQPWVDAVQVEYSILNQSVIRATGATGREKGSRRAVQEVVARSVLCKGLLTTRRTAAPRLAAQVEDALEAIDGCARQWGHTIETLAIRFALDTPGIDVVIVGVSSEAELDTALTAASAAPLTREQWQQLASFDRSGVDAAHPERWAQIS